MRRNAQNVFDADQDEQFLNELKSSKIKSARQARSDKSRTGKHVSRPISFSELSSQEMSRIREITAPRSSWLGLEPEY